MLRKIFYPLLIVGVYFWFIGSDREKSILVHAKECYAYCVKAWEELDLEWHIHTPSCKDKKRSR